MDALLHKPHKMETVIGEGCIFEGKLLSQTSIRIDGTVIGEITSSGDVHIGKTGSVKSDIQANRVVTSGLIEGSVKAEAGLTIHATGKVLADIDVTTVNIFEGGVFQGNCTMLEKTRKPNVSSNVKEKSSPSHPHRNSKKHLKAVEKKAAQS